MSFDYARNSLVEQPCSYYLEQYHFADPREISNRLKIPYYETIHAFRIRFLEQLYEVSYPNFSLRRLSRDDGPFPLEENVYARILLLRYLLEGDAEFSSGNMLSFRDLSYGDVYFGQFNTRCIQRLANGYGNRTEKFCRALERLYGVPVNYGDHAYQLTLFNRLYLCMILWDGDTEYPPSAQILFSDNFPVALSTEDAAVVADIILDAMDAC